jgi:erythromycin esterase
MKTGIILLLLISLYAGACNHSDDLVKELEESSILLPGTKPLEYVNSDLEPVFCNIKGGIVALGEAAHGSSTLFELKHRLSKYLVEEAGCRALCYEFSFEKGLDINRYVLYGEGNIDSLLYDKYWIQSNSTIKEMLSWMRDYNAGRDISEKIHFIGIDNQLDMFNPSRLSYHIKSYSNDLFQFVKPELNELASPVKPEYRDMKEEYFSDINKLIDSIEKKTTNYLANDGSKIKLIDQEIILHLIYSIRESHDFLYKAYNGGPNKRDKSLSDNVLWACSLFGDKETIAVWAHNSHISSNPDYYGKGDGTMGYYLRHELNDRYLRIATSFNSGRVIAVEDDSYNGGDTPPHIIYMDTIPVRGSINELFGKSKYDNFILDLRKIDRESPLYNYLDTIRPFLGIGDWFSGKFIHNYSMDRVQNIVNDYDIIIHIDSINPIILQGKWQE